MKRSEELYRIHPFIDILVDQGVFRIVEINGFKQVGFSLDTEESILDFIEKDIEMQPPCDPILENKWEKE